MNRQTLFFILGMTLLGLILASCSSSPSAVPLTTGTRMDPDAKVRVATDPNWPPFEFLNERTRQVEGFDVDLMNAIAEKQGFRVEFIEAVFGTLPAEMSRGLYDAAISSITVTEELKKDMLFSEPYFAAGQIITVHKDENSITEKNNLSGVVGALKGTIGAKEISKQSNITLRVYDNIGLAFQDLIQKKIKAVVCDNPVALLYIAQNPESLKTAGTVFTNEVFAIAVAKNKTDLLAKINDGLKTVRAEGFLDHLSQKWIQQPLPSSPVK